MSSVTTGRAAAVLALAGRRVVPFEGRLPEALVAERRPDPPVPPMAGTAAVGAVVHLLVNAIEEGRNVSSLSGILAGNAYRLLPA